MKNFVLYCYLVWFCVLKPLKGINSFVMKSRDTGIVDKMRSLVTKRCITND